MATAGIRFLVFHKQTVVFIPNEWNLSMLSESRFLAQLLSVENKLQSWQ